MSRQKKWISKEDEFLMNNYLTMTDKELGENLNRSKASVKNRRKILGLELPATIRECRVNNSHFTKNHKPWNKGQKGIRYSPDTEFKKGHLPHNTKYDGAISTRTDKSGRKYKYIRVSLNNWKPYHHILWEKENGKIPKGHCLWFLNGNSTDVRIENLELITRAENVRRNHSIENDNVIAAMIVRKDKKLRKEIKKHPHLLELKRKQLQLKKEIEND